jgi:hypothetical protein
MSWDACSRSRSLAFLLLVTSLLGCATPAQRASANKPELRQFVTLKSDDFDRHPVWVQCHVIDYDEPWHKDTDEETFRPWTGPLPVDPDQAMFLVKASFELADRTRLLGFVTPATTNDLGILQPRLFAPNGKVISFWVVSVDQHREAAYKALAKKPAEIFPIRFAAESGLCRGVASGTLEGFYSQPPGSNSQIRVEK